MASKSYDLPSSKDLRGYSNRLKKIASAIENGSFLRFIANKCLEELEDIESYSLVTFDEHSIFDMKVQEYEENHQVEVGKDYIYIYNETNIDQDEMFWVSAKTRENYPDGISVAYIIEYGTGIRGTAQDDWQVDMNGYGEKGWSYKSPDGNVVHTTGLEGRFIYQQLSDNFDKKLDSWIDEFIES